MKFAINNNAQSLVLGERFEPGSDARHFCQPTDVAVMMNAGDIYVADGSALFLVLLSLYLTESACL